MNGLVAGAHPDLVLEGILEVVCIVVDGEEMRIVVDGVGQRGGLILCTSCACISWAIPTCRGSWR